MSTRPKKKQSPRMAKGGEQCDLFGAPRRTPGKTERQPRVGFIDPDPRELFIGDKRLDCYLEEMGLGWVLQVREVLRSLDWCEFEERYRLTGRSPYCPASITGLVLYGTMSGRCSLRQLEELARMDLGAMWVTGGICPDHASLGRFIQLHAETLTESFFEQITREVVRAVGSKSGLLAGDGTIVEAAGSRYKVIKREAAEAAAQEAEQRAAQAPEDEELQRKAVEAKTVADAAEQRAEAQRRNGDTKTKTRVSSTEPEAAVLKGKRGTLGPAYTPSVFADENRVIHAIDVAQTDELSSIEPMLDQIQRVGDENPTLLLDGNYANGRIAELAVERDLDLLSKPKDPKEDRKAFAKQDFKYDEERQRYVCPAGQELTLRGRGHDKRRGTSYSRYSAESSTCLSCPLRSRCVTAKNQKRRIVRRYDHDDKVDALRDVMKQPRAKRVLSKRKAMVEPVFSSLRGQQSLVRFRRFGFVGARLEFAIHATAYNIRRLLALERESGSSRARLAALFLCLTVAYRLVRRLRRLGDFHHPPISTSQIRLAA